jgi:hypothetical protein
LVRDRDGDARGHRVWAPALMEGPSQRESRHSA